MELQTISSNTQFGFGGSEAYLTKITGIKYIQPDSYSTEEKLIGTWIDGKPLYQKTMSVTTPSGSRGVIATIDANYSVREISGYIIESNANTFPINFSYSGYYVCACVLSSDITIFQNGYSNLPAYITLKYTKN